MFVDRFRALADQVRRGANAARRSGFWPTQPRWWAAATRQGRLAAQQVASRVLAGPVVGRLPFTWVSSVAEIRPNPLFDGHVEDVKEGAPACTLTFPPAPPGFECFTRSVTLRPTSDFVARDVVVSPRSGVVWLDGGPILGESYGSLEQFLSWGYAAHEVLGTEGAEQTGSAAPLACVPSAGYFHLLLEGLPALLRIVERREPTTWLLWSEAPGYVRELAALLQGAGGGAVLDAPGPVRAADVRIAGRRSLSGHFDTADLDRIRRFGTEVVQRDRAGDGAERIYVTRTGATRALANEHEVGALLEERGFRVVHAGRHTIAEQIAIFADATTVVGPHGAGLANLVWCRPGTQVLELLLPERNLDCYARLSHLAGLAYRPMPTPGGRADLHDLAGAVTSWPAGPPVGWAS